MSKNAVRFASWVAVNGESHRIAGEQWLWRASNVGDKVTK